MFWIAIILIAGIWLFLEFKKLRHRTVALILIVLVLLTYFSFTASISGKNIDFSSPSGWGKAGSLYFAWLSLVFTNIKTVTSYAIGLNWNESKNSSLENKTVPVQNETQESIWNKLK